MAASIPRAQTAAGQAGLDALCAAPGRALIACDFDGTLSPIVDDPAQARAHPGVAAALGCLAPLVAGVAIITGRPPAEAVELGGLAGIPGLLVLGHYGADRWQDGQLTAAPVPPGVASVRAQLPEVLASAGAGAGVRIEDKGTALAVHTRQAADPAAELARLRAPLEALAGQAGLVLEPGKLVLELRPGGSDKGRALRGLCEQRCAGSVLFCGDDLGDLPAFAAIRELRAAGIPGCAVASASPEAAPRVAAEADLAVGGPAGVVALLAALAQEISAAS